MQMRPNACKHLLSSLLDQPSNALLSVLNLLFNHILGSKLKFQLVLKTRVVQVNQTEIRKLLQYVTCCIEVVEVLTRGCL